MLNIIFGFLVPLIMFLLYSLIVIKIFLKDKNNDLEIEILGLFKFSIKKHDKK